VTPKVGGNSRSVPRRLVCNWSRYVFHPLIPTRCLIAVLVMLYNPCLYYMSEWFVARRGLANGVISAGTATGGLILPLILPGLLEKYGVQSTLRILAVGFTLLLVPVLPFLRGRLPIAKVRGPAARSMAETGSWEWTKNPALQLLFIANTLQGFGTVFFASIICFSSAEPPSFRLFRAGGMAP